MGIGGEGPQRAAHAGYGPTREHFGTNPRAEAQRAAEASKRAEVLAQARAFGARTAEIERDLTPAELGDRLRAEAQRDPTRGWDPERIEAANAGLTDAIAARRRLGEERSAATPSPPVDPSQALRSAREALRRGREPHAEDPQLSFEDAPL